VLSHVPFEDLGSLQPELERRGFAIRTADAATAQFPLAELESCELLVVLGGPISVYETDEYPFLRGEIESIHQRLAAHKPTLGICLGAQLIATALGARVYAGSRRAEIGWSPLKPAADSTPEWFAPLLQPGLSVFHWHGDTFDLPSGAQRLASTDLYENQSFMVENFALALQFHPEVTAPGLERWYVGHTCELHQKKISPKQLRIETQKHAPALLTAAEVMAGLHLIAAKVFVIQTF
jgi:GMP synthase (glutamine-hydrolysing)